jgi:hypothetical protein
MKMPLSIHTMPTPVRRALIIMLVVAFSLAGAMAASADSGSRTLTYLIGTDFLCGLNPSACPAIAMAENGDTVEITGAGEFSIHPKSATGGGSFVHKDPDGNVLGGGSWAAVELLSFHSYGSGAVQGFPPNFEGGKILLRVQLDPGDPGGPVFDAIMRVTCLLGDKIPAGAEEGVRLNVQGLINFNEEVSGLTVFID